ncbi:MAG TPA: VOC family protein [Dermatophilaceae bacterium]|nr:VOC family protein [Dermatophilaceae bacterium]
MTRVGAQERGAVVETDECADGGRSTVAKPTADKEAMMKPLTTCLWFDDQGEQAAQFWTAIFPNSSISGVTRYGPDMPGPEGQVMTVEFTLNGQPFLALNGGPQFTFSEAVSLQVPCADQQEVDRYWDALLADGGEPGPCGWLKDKFGFSWQVIPEALPRLLGDPDPARAERATQAMLKMGKLVVADLEAAAEGEPGDRRGGIPLPGPGGSA